MPRPALALLALPLLLAACASHHAASSARPNDPDYRSFSGNIISLRFTTSTMIISENNNPKSIGGQAAIPNIVEVKYDVNTRFYLDNHPTTLDKLDRYMPVHVEGHMRDGQMFAESARFSSVLPPGISPSNVEPGPAPIKSSP